MSGDGEETGYTELGRVSVYLSKGTHTVAIAPTATGRKVKGVNTDLRVRPFFAEGGTISIREFVVGAFNAEMGLEPFDPELDKDYYGIRQRSQ